ncbi:MAG: carboxypeptidase-like regulatory domain-containing protein [Bacteroidetes bacterium]|nr:carboxypeptidase-like regulatory domain-containing protein [Bacteroidota bacterium]HET6245454.1 DUF5686 family protein [Bacteroidia bacterium]
MKNLALFFLSTFFVSGAIAQKQTITGIVIDADTKQPLAFVNVVDELTLQGTVSDIDGKFSVPISKDTRQIKFSYIGYTQVDLSLTDTVLNLRQLVIKLHKKDFFLKEFTLVAGENPSYRIIREAIKNAPGNNPEKAGSFSYTSYNKMIFTPGAESKKKPNIDDSLNIRLNDFTKKQHLFMMESVSERNFLDGMNNEKIVASRVSGLQNPSFTLLATQMQSFSFYGDYIAISEKKYLNPISSGSIGRYEYVLEDTLYTLNDTVFIISFFPKPDKNFDALKGLVYINTNLYAIQNVIAEPAFDEPSFHIKIQQKYEFIEGKQWFPVQLNTDIVYKILNVNNQNISGIGRSYIEDIKINPELKKKQFNRIELEVAADAGKKEEVFWNKYRKDSLTEKEITTYHVIDSIGKAENLDLKLKALETVMTGKIPAGYIDFDLNRFLLFNDYEGFRAGAGIHSNEKISKIFSLGGYLAYGFKDKALKYGADVSLKLNDKLEAKLKFFYINDVQESAGINFVLDRKPNLSEIYRPYLISRMDSLQQSGVTLEFRAAEFLTSSITGSHTRFNSTLGYRYASNNSDATMIVNSFNLTEITAGFRFAYGEIFIKTPIYTYSLGTNFPVVWIQLKKGFDNVLNGNFDFYRVDLKVEKSFEIKHLGKTSLQLISGHIEGYLPYTALYAGRGSFKNYHFSVMNTFETMQMNEFLSNTYASVFFNHSFGSLLFSKGKFKPELILVCAAGWGNLNNPANHFNIEYKTMEKGYYESGLRINNLIKSDFIGLGVGMFYKFGPYSQLEYKNNLAIKATFSIIF